MNEDTAMTPQSPPVPQPRRRSVLTLTVAGLAAAAGVGAAWWKFRPADVPDGAADELWRLSFDKPSGGALSMASLQGKPLLVNFWATWCPPCVEELPLLDRFYREHAGKGWQVVGLAIDQPNAVRSFLVRTPVTFPMGLAGLGGTELGKRLGNLSGGLPFTVVIGADGKILQRKMGKVTEADLRQWVQAVG